MASLGLLYTTLAQGQDSIMVPNNVVLSAAVVPLREPDAVDLRARLRRDHDEVVVRIAATPVNEAEGQDLADEILAAIGALTREEEARPAEAA